MSFDFSTVVDINFTDDEKMTIAKIYSKCTSHFNLNIWTQGQQLFIESFFRCLTVAVPAYTVPSVVAAQAIDESGWFKTRSLFGVKATSSQQDDDQGQQAVTHEVVNGKVITTVGDFYTGTLQQQFGNYFVYVKNRKPGTQQFLPKDANGYVSYLQDGSVKALNGKPSGSYSTAGDLYRNTILQIVHDNNLTVFDHF